MLLYTCNLQKKHSSWHPCAAAARALDEAGHEYEIATVRGYSSMPWTWPARKGDRTVIRELSGQNAVPILVLGDRTVVAGTAEIKRWAEANPATPATRDAGPAEPAGA